MFASFPPLFALRCLLLENAGGLIDECAAIPSGLLCRMESSEPWDDGGAGAQARVVQDVSTSMLGRCVMRYCSRRCGTCAG